MVKLKWINIGFVEEEMELLKNEKGDKSWRDFVMSLVSQKENKEDSQELDEFKEEVK